MENNAKLPPVLMNNVIYPDMADNLSKVKFEVRVKESYVPHVHYSLMRENAAPPIRSIGDLNTNDVCVARYPLTYIIDALVGGHWLEFEHVEDMTVARDWIAQYLKEYEGHDLSKYPDRAAFNKNAERALTMISGKVREMDAYNATKNSRKLDIVDLMNLL